MISYSPSFTRAKNRLALNRGKTLHHQERSQQAATLAALILEESQGLQTKKEKKIQAQLARMMKDPIGKAFTTMMTDQCFRSHRPSRIADQLCYLLGKMGIPAYLGWADHIGLRLFKTFSPLFPHLCVPVVKWMLRRSAASVILPGEVTPLKHHIEQRYKQGVRVNLNHLGEAILGETEALRRLNMYLEDLEKPEVEYISVKISTIYSQISLLAFEHTLEILGNRLRRLYQTAKTQMYLRPDGTQTSKFVNLDMEEFKDLRLTVALFKKVLEEPEFFTFSAGIVLQSYLPEAHPIQKELTEWAVQRVANGGAPIKIRIVKGANLAMEQVEASLKSWPQAPYTSKIQTDANFKRMVAYGCIPEHAKAAHIGIGTHNLFDIAYGMMLRAETNTENQVSFEMLEGMAEHWSKAVQRISGSMLLYCPAAKREEFQNAIAYLIRRLDENTGQENFLRYAFRLDAASPEWARQELLFKESCEQMDTIDMRSRRTQNRLLESPIADSANLQANFEGSLHDPLPPFQNEADTDWSLAANQQWGQAIIEKWAEMPYQHIPNVIGGDEYFSDTSFVEGKDPSRPGRCLYRCTLASEQEVEKALKSACDAQTTWSETPLNERASLLGEIAQELRRNRHALLGSMLADSGKILPEGDIEVSEAIDFAEYYRRKALDLPQGPEMTWKPKGTVLVAPPWNFPCSIPAGGILASLVTGNTVIFKPALESALVGWFLVNIFWRAGVPKEVLQFLCCQDEPVGSHLIKDPRINCVILTGATATAKHLLNIRPDLDLIAETGGKNAIIVTDMADRDLAVRDIVQSAFGHSGQKCSAASLLICEGPVYDDLHFRKQLLDAAASMTVGSAWNRQTILPPLIRPPMDALARGLSSLDDGEEWLLEPKQNPENPCLWSPGIKLGIKEGSFMHQTELFGPVLGVMRANNLEHAIQLANNTPYGLTSGIHSLDDREQAVWTSKIKAGNRYINRGITGAIVQRQPFGGWKNSCFGPGAKAGGPHYLYQLIQSAEHFLPSVRPECGEAEASFSTFNGILEPSDQVVFEASLASYRFWWNSLKNPQDPSLVLGQDNFFYLEPKEHMAMRIQSGAKPIDMLRIFAAATICKAPLEISWPVDCCSTNAENAWVQKAAAAFPSLKFTGESESVFLKRVQEGHFRCVRVVLPPSKELQSAAADSACHLASGPVFSHGRIELLHYAQEISLSCQYHRYGNLALREKEPRKPLTKSKRDA